MGLYWKKKHVWGKMEQLVDAKLGKQASKKRSVSALIVKEVLK